METKSVLQKIKLMDVHIKNIQLEIEDIRNKMKGCAGTSFEEKVPGPHDVRSPQEKLFPMLDEREKELGRKLVEYVDYKRMILNAFDKMTNSNYVDILYKRYFLYEQWEQIAIETNYSYRGVLKLHGRALKEFERVHTSTHLNVL